MIEECSECNHASEQFPYVCKYGDVRLLPMSPFSIALMSGLSLQSVGASSLSMLGSSSFSVMAKLVKLYIYTDGRELIRFILATFVK